MKKFFILCILVSFLDAARGQNYKQLSSSEIYQNLKKLNVVGSVLYIAAHPDDENTRLLSYLSKEKMLRTGYLSLTRGDGGQNLIGKEQGEALGLLRTQELLAARDVDGAEQFFTRAYDFGYSKNPEETFSIWNKDIVLSDVVWVIRKFQPDVIICRFPSTGEGGHGHHTASAILALEAFDAAADESRFPEQLKKVKPWKAKRVFWNTFNFGGNNTTSPDQLKIDVGGFNSLLGKSYGELAAESRSMHKSQGFGSAKARGTSIEYFKLLKGDSAKTDLFDGIDQTWKRLPKTMQVQKSIDECIKLFEIAHPEKSISGLIKVYNELKNLPSDLQSDYWKTIKLKQVENLIINCSGLWIEPVVADYVGIPGKDFNLSLSILARNNSDIRIKKVTWPSSNDTIINASLKHNEPVILKHIEEIGSEVSYSNPYWLNSDREQGYFVVNDQNMIGDPENKSPLVISVDIVINGLSLTLQRDVVFKSTDPVKGEVYRPVEILPAATINLTDKSYVFTDALSKTIRFVVKANKGKVKGTLHIEAPKGWNVSSDVLDFEILNKDEEALIDINVTPGKDAEQGKITAYLRVDEKNINSSIKRIEYDHIPAQFILSTAEASLVIIDLKKTGNNIGYIPGAGDDIPASLKQVGYNVTILTDELLATENLKRFDAIVTGVRAYNTNDRLQIYSNKLMDYVLNGGNLIVQYNTNNRIGPLVAKIGPYPFTISRDRVTDERAEVRFVNPTHASLNFPNKITEKDFDNWIQERGIYFATELDSNYQTVLSMNDPGQKPQEGSLIIARYGKGNFVYTGLAFFRELPAGVPGAYRLFSNLLSLPARK